MENQNLKTFTDTIQVLREQRNQMLDLVTAGEVEKKMLQHRVAIAETKVKQLEDSLIKDASVAADLLAKSDAQLKKAHEDCARLSVESKKLRESFKLLQTQNIPETWRDVTLGLSPPAK